MPYTIRHRLGRGGSGVVDLALDGAGRPVALKRLAVHGSADEMARARRRVHREAEALRRIHHPAVVSLLDVYDDGDDVVLVMPYMAGGSLEDRVRHDGPLAATEVVYLARWLLGALAEAHRMGVVHRDIKPANVLFDLDGRPHLADFGTARIRDATSGLTASGILVGTPGFMAPEQARGAEATAASDVFSLGATLRFAATGEPPYGRGEPRVLLERAARGRLTRVTGLDPVVRRLLSPMLRRDPRRRPTPASLTGGPRGTLAGGTAGVRGMRRGILPGPVPALAAVGVLALLGLAATLAEPPWSPGGGQEARAESEQAATHPTGEPPCNPLPYQPCGEPAASNTDGVRCTGGHADYDGDPLNGCEAAPDGLAEDVPLVGAVTANLVPAGDTDRYPTEVTDRPNLFCDGVLTVSLWAPRGTAMRLDIFDGAEVVGGAVSRDGAPARVSLVEPSCLADDSTVLTARVSWVGDARSAEPYRIERSGSF